MRIKSFSLPLIISLGIVISFSTAYAFWTIEQRHSRYAFEAETRELSALISLIVDNHLKELENMHFLLEYSNEVTEEKFRTAARDILKQYASIEGISWIESLNNSTLTEQPGLPQHILRFIEPSTRGKDFIGYNMNTEPAFVKVAEAALANGHGQVLAGEKLAQKPVKSPIFIIPVSLLSQGRRVHKGFVALTLNLIKVINHNALDKLVPGINFAIINTEEPGAQHIIYKTDAFPAEITLGDRGFFTPLWAFAEEQQYAESPDPKWSLYALPSDIESNLLQGQTSRVAFLAGILITLLTALFFYSRQQKLAIIEQQANELRIANLKLSDLARTDGLTGLPNRRTFDETIASEWRRCAREKQQLSVALFDIDYFKPYNDHYGHQGGDECLISVARILANAANRAGDLVARYGGEEFVMILPGSSANALTVLNRFQDELAQAALPHEASTVKDRVTMSIGLCTQVPGSDSSYEALIENADKALYTAKGNGRNQVSICH